MSKKLKSVHYLAFLLFLLPLAGGCNETTPIANPTAKITAVSQTVTGNKVTLDARGSSDPGARSLKYSFTVASPSGFAPVESDPNSPLAYFIPTQAGAYTAQIIASASDGRKSLAARQVITAEKLALSNITPTGKDVNLPVTISWTCNGGEDTLYFVHMLVGGTPVLISPETGQKTKSLTKSFSNNMTVQVQITASNNGLIEKSDIAQFITKPNTPPSAEAGQNQSVYQGALVHLAGTGSDPNGDPVAFSWEIVSGPSQIDMTNAKGANFSFTALAPGRYIFNLVVSDTVSATRDSITVDVSPIQLTGLVAATLGPETLKKLSWQCNVPAQYEIFLSTTQEFGSRSAYVDANSYTPPNLCHGTTYYWKVKANYLGSVIESASNTFTISDVYWEQVALADKAVNCIHYEPNDKVIYVGTDNGLLGLSNGGTQFVEIIPQIKATGICLSDPNNGYISTRGNGILKLANGILATTHNIPDNVSTVGIAPFDPNMVVAPTLYDGIFISRDGINFQNAYPGARSSSNSLTFVENGIFIATNLGMVSYSKENRVWALDNTSFEAHPLWCAGSFDDQLMCANDVGNIYFYSAPQWSKASLNLSCAATCILYVAPDLVYIGKNDGGVERFNGSWNTYSQGLPNSQITSLSTDGAYVYAGNAQGLWRILAR